MIKVLIIDDEYLVRERLKICVEWASLGYEIAGEADNGEDALMMLEHIPARLAIVDINMPIVDGLAFAQAAQTSHPELKIVILTGYSSFEYARTAIQAGVSDYLLKPINMEELVRVLVQLRGRIESETHKQRLNADLQLNLAESDGILKREFLQTCLDGTADVVRDKPKYRLYCPNLIDGALFVTVVSIDKTGAEPPPLWQKFAVANVCGEVMQSSGFKHFESTYDADGRIVLIASIPSGTSADAGLALLLQTCSKAIRAVHDYLKFTVTAGIGPSVHGIADAAASYREAVRACRHKTVCGNNRIIRWDQLPGRRSEDLSYIREDMIILLRLGDAEAIETSLDRLSDSLIAGRQPVETLYLVLYELMTTLNIFASENKLEAHAAIIETLHPMKLVDELETLDAIKRWLREQFRNALVRAKSLKQSTPTKLASKAKQYIDENFGNAELDLTDIAKSVFVNPSYLSRIFKNELGYSVVEYLTRCRMLKAKELMEQGCKNMFFIAESVGYKDTHYFSKCFKKHYSVSPSKFIAGD